MTNADAIDDRSAADRVSFWLTLLSMVMGLSYFFLSELARSYVTRTPLPAVVRDFWYAYPLPGAWLMGGFESLIVHWLIGMPVGLALALLVRRHYWFFGAVATGTWLMMALQTRIDGWYALLQVGPEFWWSLRLDGITHDPIGSLSALIALSVCTWFWGKVLS